MPSSVCDLSRPRHPPGTTAPPLAAVLGPWQVSLRTGRVATLKPAKVATDVLGRARAHHRAGRVKEAEELLRRILVAEPAHAQALFELGGLLFAAGRFAEASQYLERLVAIRPDEPVYLTNLGEAYRRQDDLTQARRALARALAVDPDLPEAQHNLGITLTSAGSPAEGVVHLERAVELAPGNPSFLLSLAWAELQLHRTGAALAHCRRAVELAPDLAMAHRQLAQALTEHGDRRRAIASYRRALALDPTDHHAHSNLILVALTDPSFGAAEVAAEARAWAQQHAAPLAKHRRRHGNDRNPDRPLRVGYVSPDFRAHPAQQFLQPLLRHHDPAAFEVYLYASVERPDEVTAECRALAGEHYRDIRRLDDTGAAEQIRRDRIDILVDLALHGAGNRLRLFAAKPAPVQLTWLGYAGTTGLESIDYRITDPSVDPPGGALSVYAEQSLYLPETSWCYAPLASDLPVGPLPALAGKHLTFGCQGSYRKVHAGALALWARVLGQVPAARLFLYAELEARAGMLRTLEAAGVAAERVDFGGRVSRREYLERYHRIDVAFDTFPFAGATTSLDAAWMGVPVLTLAGPAAHQRAGVCIATNLGLPELVATSEDDFVAKAVALAGNLADLSRLRADLRSRLEASPLGDAPRFARHLEAAFRTAWRRYCAMP
jgi:protein O-GlcNAc transferase